jgi:Arc/MetJ family transcription regulator
MATNLDLDPDLVERALALSGESTKRAAVTSALREFIARREQRRLVGSQNSSAASDGLILRTDTG